MLGTITTAGLVDVVAILLKTVGAVRASVAFALLQKRHVNVITPNYFAYVHVHVNDCPSIFK